MANMYCSSPRKIRQFITDCIWAGLVPMVTSSPGMGKSSIVSSIADELNLKLIDHRLSTSEPSDLTGLPFFNGGRAEFQPFRELFPIEGDELPAGKDGWLLFLDEFTSATKSVQAAAYKLVLDRMVGQKHLHTNVVIVAAGNLTTDRAIVNTLSTAMQSRLVHLEMEINFQEWLEDVAIKQKYDSRIIGFLAQWPSKLMDFRPDHTEKTFACPRTWEFINKLIKGKDVDKTMAALLAGTITSGIAAEFIQFCQIYTTMLSLKQIVDAPDTIDVPTDASTKWAVTSMLIEKLNEDNADKVFIFMNRMSLDFRVLFFRSILVTHPEMRRNPEFHKAIVSLSNYING